MGVGNLIASLDFMLRVALIPRGVINIGPMIIAAMMMGHLNSFSASGVGNLNKNFSKNSNARGLPGGGGCLSFD